MEEKKITSGITAVDTGRRIDIGNLSRERRPVRRRPRPADAKPAKEEKAKEASTGIEAPKEEVRKEPVKIEAPLDLENRIPAKKIPLYAEPLEFDETGDFASLLDEAFEQTEPIALKIGDKVTGKVVHIGREHIFLALGPKIEAAIATSEYSDDQGTVKVRIGQKVTAYVVSTTGGVTLSNDALQSGLDQVMLQDACNQKVPVEGKVLSVNKGGFDIQLSGFRAFCPIGQIDLKFVEDTSSFIGKTLPFLIERVEENGRNIVVSRRRLLERERREKALATIEELENGKKFDAVISRVTDFGAFADIGGLEGLIPRSEIAHGHIDKVSDMVSSGDRVEVIVLSFDINESDLTKSKLSLSLKKTKEDPYSLHWNKIKVGTTLEGRVVRLEPFGAFVELFPGIDGLIHISELSENRVSHPKEILNVNDPVTVRIITVDDEEKRIGLSLRETVAKKTAGSSESAPIKLSRGEKVSGMVSRIERYGAFLELENGAVALLPQSETGLPKHADLSRSFKIGDRLESLVIDVDAQNRIRVSLVARKNLDERDSFLQFQTEEIARHGSFGTFADLVKKKTK